MPGCSIDDDDFLLRDGTFDRRRHSVLLLSQSVTGGSMVLEQIG